MKFIAILLNVGTLTYIGFALSMEGFPAVDDPEFFVAILWIVTPLFTLLAFFFGGLDSWCSLYFRSKAAEERVRLAELEDKLCRQSDHE